jgi:hypothetical protein
MGGIISVTVACERCGKEHVFSTLDEAEEFFESDEVDGVQRMFLSRTSYGRQIYLCLGCANRLYKWFENTSYREKERNRKNLSDINETNIEGGTQHEEESIV